jgi:hypothetical protein
LDFDLLLGRYYVYAMKAIVSTIFLVIYFPQDGRIVTIDQLSFIGLDLITNPMNSLNGYYMQMVSSLPHVNYVALSPMPSATDEDVTLPVSSVSSDLDLVVDMVISLVGLLELDLPTLIITLDMCSFQRVLLPLSGDLLEAMTKFCPLIWCPFRALSSWNP